MYLCYVDESGDPGPQGSRFLILGAAAVFEGRWRNIQSDLDHLLRRHFPAPAKMPIELHMADVRKGKGVFST